MSAHTYLLEVVSGVLAGGRAPDIEYATLRIPPVYVPPRAPKAGACRTRRTGWACRRGRRTACPRFRDAFIARVPRQAGGQPDHARKWPHTSDESHPVSVEDRGQFRTSPKLAPDAGRQLRYSAIVDCQVVLAVQPRGVPDSVGVIGMLVERQARPLTEPMRRGPQCIRRQSQRKDCAGSQVNNIERLQGRHRNMRVVIQVALAERERSWIAVLAVA